jgi:hypothetical protein
MRINSEKAIKLGKIVYRHFGRSWQNVKNNSTLSENGHWVINEDPVLSEKIKNLK